MVRRVVSVASLILALAGCSADAAQPAGKATAAPVPVTVSGAVQKGPFLLGSSVTVTPVSNPAAMSGTSSSAALAADESAHADVAAEGQVFKTETSNDRGQFEVSLTYQGPASIEATGYYYNEATGSLSAAPLTLRALGSIGDTDGSLNVNLITHLTYQRVKNLMAGGVEFAEASAQAESELQSELGFGTASKAATELNLEGGDDDSNAYLFAVSTVFAQAAYLDAHAAASPNVDGRLQELVNTASAALAVDGALSAETKTKLVTARQTVDNVTVEAALAQRLTKTGSTATPPSLERVIPWSAPDSVISCAAAVLPSVSLGCRMAVCGADMRPLDQSSIQSMQNLQTEFSTAKCDGDCWTALSCVMQNCVKVLDSGAKALVAGCSYAKCNAGQWVDENGTRVSGAVESPPSDAIFDYVKHHECDADLGIAK